MSGHDASVAFRNRTSKHKEKFPDSTPLKYQKAMDMMSFHLMTFH